MKGFTFHWKNLHSILFISFLLLGLAITPAATPVLISNRNNLNSDSLSELYQQYNEDNKWTLENLQNLNNIGSSVYPLQPTWTFPSGFDPHGPYIDRLVWKVYPVPSGDLGPNLIAGDIDGIDGRLVGLDLEQFFEYPEITTTASNSTHFRNLAMNCEQFPTNISGYRRALAFGLDKYRAVEESTQGNALPMDGAIPICLEEWTFEDQISEQFYTQNIAAANASLDAAGFRDLDNDGWREYDVNNNGIWDQLVDLDDEDCSIELWGTEGFYPAVNACRVCYEGMELMGLRGTAVEVTFDQLIEGFETGSFSLSCFTWIPSLNRPGEIFYQTFRSGTDNNNFFYRFSNATYDSYADALKSATTFEEAKNLAWECQKILLEQMPMITCYNTYILNAIRTDRWEGWVESNDWGYTLDNLYSYTHVRLKPEHGGPLGGTLTMSQGNDLVSHNVISNNDGGNNKVFKCIYDRLWQLDPFTHEPVPMLASDWLIEETLSNGEILDGQKLTLHLYPNATWHDGVPVTADDVKYTFDTLWPETNRFTYGELDSIYRIETPDMHTVVIYSTNPSIFEYQWINEVYILPKHVWKLHEAEIFTWNPETANGMIGSGPFRWVDHIPGEQIILDRHQQYHLGLQRPYDPHGPYIDWLSWQVYPAENKWQALEALQNGLVDGFDEPLTFGEMTNFVGDPDITTSIFASDIYRQFVLNCQRFPTNITGYRRALAYALDKYSVVDRAVEGLGVPADSAIPIYDRAWTFEHQTKEHFYELNIVLANASLEAAGFIDLDGDGWREYDTNDNGLWDAGIDFDDVDFAIELMVSIGHTPAIEAALVQIEGMEDCGLHGLLLEASFDEIINRLTDGTYNLGCFSWRIQPYEEAKFLHDFFYSTSASNQFFYRFENDTFDIMADAALTALTIEEAQFYVRECQKILLEQMPMIVCYNEKYVHAYQTTEWEGWVEMQGYGVTGNRIHSYKNTRLKPDHGGPLGGELRMVLTEGMDTTNPIMTDLLHTHQVFSCIYDTLWQLNPYTLETIPSLAYDWIIEETFENGDIKDGMKFTFYLFPNATWHDGLPVTAEDVKYSLETIWPQSWYAWDRIEDIYQINTPNAYTVEIYINSTGISQFFQATDLYILPKHIWEPHAPDFATWELISANDLTGSGPFKWIDRNPGTEVLLQRHTEYHLGIERDETPPEWIETPTDQFVEFGTDFYYDLNATDPSGIAVWEIDPCGLFFIYPDGVIRNLYPLEKGAYPLQITVYDTAYNFQTAMITVYVQDTTPPEWLLSPGEQSIRHWQSLKLAFGVWDLSGIGSWTLNDSTHFALSESYYPLGSIAELTNVGHLEVGTYALNVSVSDTEGNWAIAIFTIEVTQQVELQLSGSFDFLLKEEIHLQLAALLRDKDTGQPISGATTFVEIYDPDGVLIVNESMIEELPNSGIYVYTSAMTLKEWKLPKGIYLVQAYAHVASGVEAFDMIQFHIDPPSDAPVNPVSLIGVIVIILGVAVIATVLIVHSRRRNQIWKLKSLRGNRH